LSLPRILTLLGKLNIAFEAIGELQKLGLGCCARFFAKLIETAVKPSGFSPEISGAA
jgi:hypothetical protein